VTFKLGFGVLGIVVGLALITFGLWGGVFPVVAGVGLVVGEYKRTKLRASP
jgi:hypothetical protein